MGFTMDKELEDLGRRLSLTESESQSVQIPDTVWNTNAIKPEFCLVGRVLSRKVSRREEN